MYLNNVYTLKMLSGRYAISIGCIYALCGYWSDANEVNILYVQFESKYSHSTQFIFPKVSLHLEIVFVSENR